MQISYQSIESSDPGINVPGPRRTVSKLRNETYHMFSGLHPGTTYLVSVRARTTKGFGQTALTEITTNISGEPTEQSSTTSFLLFFFSLKCFSTWERRQKAARLFQRASWLNITCCQIIQIIFTFLAAQQLSLGRTPSFDEIMAHLNDGGATSVAFFFSFFFFLLFRGETGFVVAHRADAARLAFGGGWEIEATAAAAVQDKSSWYESSDGRSGKACVSGDCGRLASSNVVRKLFQLIVFTRL